MAELVVGKSEFARLLDVHPSQVTKYIEKGKIGPEALVGSGRTARIRVELAKTHLRVRLDSAQRLGNGLGTRLAPAKAAMPELSVPAEPFPPERADDEETAREPRPTSPPPDGSDPENVGDDALDAEIKREKLDQLRRANRRADVEEAAEQGRYTETAAARRQLGVVAAQVLRVFEGGIPELATAFAARFEVDEREAMLLLVDQFRRLRADASEKAAKIAGSLDAVVPDGEATED